MRWHRLSLAIVLLISACSGSTDKTNNDNSSNSANSTSADMGRVDVSAGTCEGANEDWWAAADALPQDCEVATDCALTQAVSAGHEEQCLQYGVRADADLSGVDAAWDTLRNCADRFDWCVDTQVTEIWGASRAGCVNQACGTIPDFACTFLAPDSLPPVLRSCSSSDDCEVRSDLNPCGCPEAVSTLSYDDDTTLTEVGAAFYEAAGVECSLAAKCATLDCAIGTSAICEAGACVLAP